tara:strand:- start:1831 stop:2721 length:891 start_codon:yes stop_codon:yes gene_type:complete
MNFDNIYILEDRGILFVSGSDSKLFLQNLITNDINKINDQNTCFASLLTPQGKFLYDFIIAKHKTGYLIDCEKNQTKELMAQLNIYKLRSKVEITNLSNEFVVAAFEHQRFLSFKEAKDINGYTFKYREDIIFLDPRHKKLGGRLIINIEKLYLSLKKLKFKVTEPQKYYDFSFQLGIPQKNMKKLAHKIFGIECNFEELNGIDFKKGCYVGQENTARMKLKDKLVKRLFPIEVIRGNINEKENIFIHETEIGKILIDERYPFALIKYKNDKFDFNLIYNTINAEIKIKKPNWIND